MPACFESGCSPTSLLLRRALDVAPVRRDARTEATHRVGARARPQRPSGKPTTARGDVRAMRRRVGARRRAAAVAVGGCGARADRLPSLGAYARLGKGLTRVRAASTDFVNAELVVQTVLVSTSQCLAVARVRFRRGVVRAAAGAVFLEPRGIAPGTVFFDGTGFGPARWWARGVPRGSEGRIAPIVDDILGSGVGSLTATPRRGDHRSQPPSAHAVSLGYPCVQFQPTPTRARLHRTAREAQSLTPLSPAPPRMPLNAVGAAVMT